VLSSKNCYIHQTLERNVDQFPQLNQFGAMAWEFRWENEVQQTIANQFNSAR